MKKDSRKRSPWFAAKKYRPSHIGLYECEECNDSEDVYRKHYWDGEKWFHHKPIKGRDATLMGRDWRWRGLAEKPK